MQGRKPSGTSDDANKADIIFTGRAIPRKRGLDSTLAFERSNDQQDYLSASETERARVLLSEIQLRWEASPIGQRTAVMVSELGQHLVLLLLPSQDFTRSRHSNSILWPLFQFPKRCARLT
jgi:hypothetical protein